MNNMVCKDVERREKMKVREAHGIYNGFPKL